MRLCLLLCLAMTGLADRAAAQSPISRARAAEQVFAIIADREGTEEYATLRARYPVVAKVDAFRQRRLSVPLLAEIPSAEEFRQAEWILDPPVAQAPTEAAAVRPSAMVPSAPPPPAFTLSGIAVGGTFGASAIVPVVTDFIIDRAKQEVVRAYLPSLSARLETTPLGALLPNARVVLRAAHHVDYRFLIPSLKVALQEDLTAAPYGLAELLQRGVPARYASPVNGALLGMRAFRGITNGVHPIKLLGALDTDTAFTKLLPGRVRFAGRVVASLARDYDSTSGRLDEMLRDRQRAWLVWAFAAEQAADPGAPASAELQSWVNIVGTGWELVAAFANELETIKQEFEEIEDVSREERIRSLLAVVASTDRGMRWLGRFTSDTLGSAYQTFTTRGIQAARAAVEKQYVHAVVLASSTIYDLQCGGDNACEGARKFVRGAMPVLTLVATIASADSSADIVRALTAAAAPVGSYRDKRLPRTNRFVSTLTVDSYVGFGVGREQLTPGGTAHDVATIAGVALPIGIEVGRAELIGGSSLGLLISPVDLGVVASPRLSGRDDVPESESLTWSQLFSPAAYLIVGLGKSPFATGIGFQAVPNARRDQETGRGHDALRARVFFAVNVVLFNLWQSSAADPDE